MLTVSTRNVGIDTSMFSFVYFFVFVLLDVCVFTVEGKFKIDSKCAPPRGDVCVEIRKCPFFADLLERTSIPRPRDVIKIIREHQCGFFGNTPKVCCAKIVKTQEKVVEQIDSIAPDVTEHPNLSLLPWDICGPISNDFRITSGTSTGLMEFPWMALLAYSTEDGIDFKCGGSLINEIYVITAAHCILNSTIVGVRLGEHNINTEEDCDNTTGSCAPPVQDFFIEDISVHPKYNPMTFANDIALIRLATPANFSYGNVQPICLPVGKTTDFDLTGKFATVSGWGVTENGYRSAELLKVSVPVVDNDECRNLYKRHSPITNKQLCAGGYLGRDSCAGDSGGPLKYARLIKGVPRYVQYGIVSFGPRLCGVEGRPGIYTRITHYMDWILNHLKPYLD